MNLITKIFVLIYITVSVPFIAAAQFDTPTVDEIPITLSPRNPGPNETVRATAKSFSFNNDTAQFFWTVNGVSAESGKGITSVVFTTKELSSKTTVSVRVVPIEIERTYSNTIVIHPSSVDMLWSAQTYTPPTYRGRALPVVGSIVRITAIPSLFIHGSRFKNTNLIYEWRVNGKRVSSAGGRGKQVFNLSLSGGVGVTTRVSVHVSDDKKQVSQNNTIEVAPRDRNLLFYELDPLRGPLYANALGETYTMASGETKHIIAEPYYSTSPPRNLLFLWRVGDTTLTSTEETKHILTYRSEAGSTARQIVTLLIDHKNSLFDAIQNTFTIHVQ